MRKVGRLKPERCPDWVWAAIAGQGLGAGPWSACRGTARLLPLLPLRLGPSCIDVTFVDLATLRVKGFPMHRNTPQIRTDNLNKGFIELLLQNPLVLIPFTPEMHGSREA